MVLSDQLFWEFALGKQPTDVVNPIFDGQNRASDTNDMYQNFLLLYSFVKFGRFEKILELGVHDGTSTIALLKAAGEREGTTVTSVDITEVPFAERLVDTYGYRNIWTIKRQSTDQFFAENKEMFSLIIIDAAHLYEETWRDFENSLKILTPGGFILMHDSYFHETDNKAGTSVAVYRIIKERSDVLISILPFGCNFSIIQRKEDAIEPIVHSKWIQQIFPK